MFSIEQSLWKVNRFGDFLARQILANFRQILAVNFSIFLAFLAIFWRPRLGVALPLPTDPESQARQPEHPTGTGDLAEKNRR
jgi:hypothetical protein